MLVHHRLLSSTTQHFVSFAKHLAGTHLYTWVERGTVRVTCLAQEHDTTSPVRIGPFYAQQLVQKTCTYCLNQFDAKSKQNAPCHGLKCNSTFRTCHAFGERKLHDKPKQPLLKQFDVKSKQNAPCHALTKCNSIL